MNMIWLHTDILQNIQYLINGQRLQLIINFNLELKNTLILIITNNDSFETLQLCLI